MEDLHIKNSIDSSGALRLTAGNYSDEMLNSVLEGKTSFVLCYMLNDIIRSHLERTRLLSAPVNVEQIKEYLLDGLFRRSHGDTAKECDIMVWTSCPGDWMWGHPIFVLARRTPGGPLERLTYL